MSQFNMQTIEGVRSALAAGATTSEKLVEETAAIFQADAQSELPLNAFLEIYDDAILRAKEADELRAKAAAAVEPPEDPPETYWRLIGLRVAP